MLHKLRDRKLQKTSICSNEMTNFSQNEQPWDSSLIRGIVKDEYWNLFSSEKVVHLSFFAQPQSDVGSRITSPSLLFLLDHSASETRDHVLASKHDGHLLQYKYCRESLTYLLRTFGTPSLTSPGGSCGDGKQSDFRVEFR